VDGMSVGSVTGSGNNVSGIPSKDLYMGRVSWKNIECMDL